MSDENNKKDSFGLLKLSQAMLHKLKRYGVDDPQAFSAAWDQSFVNPLQRHFEQYDQDYKSQKSECDRRQAILSVSRNKLKSMMTTLAKRDENQNSVHQVGVSFKEYANNKRSYETSEAAFKKQIDTLKIDFLKNIQTINKSSNDIASKLSQLGQIDFGLLEGLTTDQLLESIDHLEGHNLYLASAHNKASWWRWVFFWRHKEYTQDRNQFSILLRNLGQVEITLRILAIKHYLRISQAKSHIQEDSQEATQKKTNETALLARDIEQLLAKDIEHLKALKSFIRQGGARLGIFKLTNLENFLTWVKSKRASKLNKKNRQHLMAHYKTQSTVIQNELNHMCDYAVELGVHKVVDEALASLTAVDPVKEWQHNLDQDRQNFITDTIFGRNNVKSIVENSIHMRLVRMYPELKDSDESSKLSENSQTKENKASTSGESKARKHNESYYDPLAAKVFYCVKTLIPKLLENSSSVQSSHDNVILNVTIRKLDLHIDTLNKKTKSKLSQQESVELEALKTKLLSHKSKNKMKFSEQDVIKICQMKYGVNSKKFKKSINDCWGKLDIRQQNGFYEELNCAQNSIAHPSYLSDSLWDSNLITKIQEGKKLKGDQQNDFSSLGEATQHTVKQMAYVYFSVFGVSGGQKSNQTEREAFCDFLQLSCHRYSVKGMMHGIRNWFGSDQKKPLMLKRQNEIEAINCLNNKLSEAVKYQIANQNNPQFNYNFSEVEIDLLIKAYAQYKRLYSDDTRMDLINNMCQSGLTAEKRQQFLDTLAQGFNRISHEVSSAKKAEKEDVLKDTVDALTTETTEGSVGSSKLLTSSITEKSSQDSSRFFYHVKEDIQSMFASMKRFFVSDERRKHRKIHHTQRKITRYFEGLFNELQLGNVQCGNLILLDGSEASQCSKAVSSSSKEICGIEEIKVAGKSKEQCDSLVNGLVGKNEDNRVVEESIVGKFHKAFFNQVVKKYFLLASNQSFSQINQESLKKLLSMIILNRFPDEKNKALQNDSDDSQSQILGINFNDAIFKKLRKTFRSFVKKQMTNSGSKKAMTSGRDEQNLHRNFRDRKQYQLFASILHEYAYSNEDNPESILRMNDLLKLNLTTVADFILHVNRKGNNGKYISPWISKDISLLHLAKKNAMVLHALKNKQVALKKLFSPSERKKWIKVCQWARDLARGEQSAYIPAGEDGSFWKSTKKQQNCVELLVKYGNADSQKTVNDYIGVASNKTQENATNIKNEDDSLVLYYLNQRLHELKEQYNSEGLSEAWKLEVNHLFELAKCAKKSLSTELLIGDIKENMELFLNDHEVSKTKQKKLKDAIREISHADPIGQPATSTINALYRLTKKSLEEFAQDFTVDEAKRIHAVTMLVGLPEDDLFSKSFKDAVNMFESSKEAHSLSPWLSLIQNGDQKSKLSIEGVMNDAGLLGKNPVLHKRFKEQFPAITEHVYKQMSDWLFRYIQGNLSKQAFDVLLPYVQNTQNIPLIQAYYAQAFSAVIQDGFTSQSNLEHHWNQCMPAYSQAMKINGKPELASQYKVLDKVLLSILSVKLPLNETSTTFNEAEQFAKKALKLWQLMADASAYTKNNKSLKSFSQFHETQEYLRQLWFRAFLLSHGDGDLVIDNEKSNSNNKPEEMLSRSFYHQDFERSTETQKILSKQIYDENIKLNDTLAAAYASPSNLCTLEKWGESNVDKRDENWHLAHKYLRNQRVKQINELFSRPKQDFGSNRIIRYCELIRNHSKSLNIKNQSTENKKLLNQVVSEIGTEVANSVENTTRAIAGGVGITPDFIRPNLVSTALGNDGYKAISKSLDSFVQDFELLSTQHDQKSQNKDQTYQNTYKKPFDALKFFDTFATKKQWSDLFAKILEQLLGANNKDQIELFISTFQSNKEWTHFELLSLRDDQKRNDVNDAALDEVSQKTSRSLNLVFSQRYQVAYSKFSSDCFKTAQNAQTNWSSQREYLFHAFADDKELFAFRVGKMQSILDQDNVQDSLSHYLTILTSLNGFIHQEKANATARLMPHDLTEAHQKLLDQTLSAYIKKSLVVVSGSSNPNELTKQEIYGYGHSLFKVVEQWSQDNVLQSSARLLFLKHLVVDQSSKMDHLDSIRSYNKTNCLDDQNQDNIYLNAGDLGHFIGYIQAIMEEEGKEFSKDVSRISAWCNLLDKQIQCHDEQAKYAKEHFSKALKFKRFVHLLVHAEDYTGQDDCLFGKGSEVFDAKAVFNLESNKEREDFSQALLDLVKGTLQSNDEIFYEWYKSYSNLQLKPKLDKIREEFGKDTEEKKPVNVKALHDILDQCYKKHPVDNSRTKWINDLRADPSQSNFNVNKIKDYFNKHHIKDAPEKIQELNTIVSMTQDKNRSSLLHAMGFYRRWRMVEAQQDIKSQNSEIQKVLARGESFIAELDKIEEHFITDNEKFDLSSLRGCFRQELSTVTVNTCNNQAPLMTAIARLFRDPTIGLGQGAFKAEKSDDQTLIGCELEKNKVYLPSAEYFTNKPNMAIYWLKALPELYEQRHFEAKKEAIKGYVDAFCKGFLPNNQGGLGSQHENTLTTVQKKELTDLMGLILGNIDCWQQKSNPIPDSSGNSSQSDSESSVPGSPNNTSPKVEVKTKKVKPKRKNGLDNDVREMMEDLAKDSNVDQDLIAQMEASNSAMQHQLREIQERKTLMAEQEKAKKKTSQKATNLKGSPSKAGMHGSGSPKKRGSQDQAEVENKESTTAGNNKKKSSGVAGLFGSTGNKGKGREIKDGKIETPLNIGIDRVLGKKVNK